jgi:hypothetical protein
MADISFTTTLAIRRREPTSGRSRHSETANLFLSSKLRATDFYGNLSPDGKWAAYESDESGRGEIYVVPFPEPGGKWQISTGGGIAPIRPPRNELFYETADAKLVAVEFATRGANFIVGKSRLLLGGRSLASVNGIDVNRHGKRWLMAMPVGEPNASPLILTTNWNAMLRPWDKKRTARAFFNTQAARWTAWD